MSAASTSLHRREPPQRNGGGEPIVIGLVNNMPDAALRTTELQVRDLLSRAAGDLTVSLRIFSLPEVPRSEAGRLHVAQYHEPAAALWASRVDALILTGTEPKAPSLEEEPYWAALARLIDWAEEHTSSTVWSCFVAHAAAHHLDGVGIFADHTKIHPIDFEGRYYKCRGPLNMPPRPQFRSEARRHDHRAGAGVAAAKGG